NFFVYDQEDYEELYQAVADMTEKYQQVIDLYYFKDLSVKEVANILGTGQSWVKIILYRGRKQLRKILEERGYDYEHF
ncbi:RNA polymerase sigma factor, partial [Streptococcus suis]